MPADWISIRVLVPTRGGLSFRPFVPDPHRTRLPPRVRFEASALGMPLGVLELTSRDDGTAIVESIALRYRWGGSTIAGRLLHEADSLSSRAPGQRLEAPA
jgi:hypothetical protein